MGPDALKEELERAETARLEAEARIHALNAEIARKNAVREELSGAAKSILAGLSSVFMGSAEGILVESNFGTVLFANPAFSTIFGIPASGDELRGRKTSDVFRMDHTPFADPATYLATIRELKENGQPEKAPELELTNGKILAIHFAPISEGVEVFAGCWRFCDVTAERNFHSSLARQKKFYERILNNIPGDIAAFDTNHKYLFLNPEAVRNPEMREWLIGRDDEEYCKYTNKPYKIAETRNRMFDQVYATGKMAEFEERLTGKDGRTEYHLRKMYPVYDDDNKLEMVVGYSVNITRNKTIEEQAQKSQKRYREIFSYSQAWICTHTLAGEILTINPAACRILGYTEQEMVGRNIGTFLHPKMQKEFEEEYLQKIRDIGVTDGILTMFSRTGEKVHMLYQNYLLSEPDSEPYVIGFAQNITDRLYAEEALKRSEEKYRKIIENMNLGLMEMDADEQIIFANQQFCSMSGYSLSELLSQKATDLFLEDPNSRVITERTWKRQYGISNRYEFKIKTKSGDSRWWLVSTAPLHNADGSLKGSISIHLDISRQKKMEKDLREAMHNAEHSSQAKEAFLANMSHEIRTPINAIMGMGKLLAKSNLNKQQLFYLSSIRTASENLLVIINDILDISKIEAGKITLEHITFDLAETANHAINMLQPKAEEKGLEITKEIDEEISRSLLGDPYRINQVFINMLSNAIKFTEKGHIHFSAKLLLHGDNAQKVLVTIEDTGVGISEEFLNVIFNKFTQEDETVVRKFGGTGLGMSITKQLMELMGGSIEVHSRKNAGTTIKLTFNLRIGTQRVLEKKRAVKTDTSNIGNKKVLLVEDNELNRLLAYTILTQHGAIVTNADNGLAALEAVQAEKFDIILMDVQMPKMDGVRATEIIRENYDKTIPIIALTANALKGKREEYIKAGMNDYIAKPYNEEKMIAVIANWLHKSEQNAAAPVGFADDQENEPATIAAPAQAPAVQATAARMDPDAPLYDIKKLMIKCGDNTDFLVQMLSLFISDVPQSMQKIREAYQDDDLSTVKYMAHRIRPALLNMSIESVKDESYKLESLAAEGIRTAEMEQIIEKMSTVINAVTARLKAEYHI